MAAPPESALAVPNSTTAPAPPRIAATDGELLRLFAKRCEQKSPPPADDPFAQIMDRHQAMVWRVCRGVLHRRQDAEDAFQATFLILAKRARSIHASESAAGWLYRVAHRTALAARRRRRKLRETEMDGEPLTPETALPDLATREMAGVLMEELRRLPTRYQTPLVLRYLEGQSRRAIAEQTDATIATVQGQIARGKALLRRRLVQRGVSLSAAMAIVAGSGSRAESAPLTVLGPTTSNATATAAGSSLVASTAVVSLFREGVRAMLLSQAAKPAAALAIAVVALLLMSAPSVLGEASEEAKADEQLLLDTELPVAVEAGEATTVALATENEEQSDAMAPEAEAESVAQAGTRVVVFGRAKPAYHGVSANGDYMLVGRVKESGKLTVQVPGRTDGQLGGYLDTTTTVELDVKGKSRKEIQQQFATWLKDHNIIAMNKIVDGKWRDKKDLKAVDTTVTRIDFAGEKKEGEAYTEIYEGAKLSHKIIGLITTVTNTTSNVPQVAYDWQGQGGLVVNATEQAHQQIARAVELLQEDDRPSESKAKNTFHRFRPGESMLIQVAGALPDAPIDDVYVIEPTGTVALGPVYGRVKLAKMTISEAEASLKEHLRGILKDPEVQITNATATAAPTRPTPLNGTVKESWPSGQTKSEREYEEGKIVAAVEYAEDGTPLYEFVDHGPRAETKPKNATATKLSPEEQQDKLFAEVELLVKQAEGHLALATEMIESGGSMLEVNDFVRARADQARSFASSAERKLNEDINNSVATTSRRQNSGDTQSPLIERIRPLAQRIGAADSKGAQYQTQDTVQRMVQAAQAKREDMAAAKVRKEEPPQELDLDEQLSQIEELIEKAEAGADKAEKLALFALGSDGQRGVIQRVFLKQTKVASSAANRFASKADQMLEEMVAGIVQSGASGESQISPEALSELQIKVAPLAKRLQSAGSRIGKAYSVERLRPAAINEYRAQLEQRHDPQAEPKGE